MESLKIVLYILVRMRYSLIINVDEKRLERAVNMARGVAKTPEQKIAEIEAIKAKYQEKIDEYRGKIAELDNQIKAFTNEQKEAELEKLLQAITASGKTVDEIMEALNNK